MKLVVQDRLPSVLTAEQANNVKNVNTNLSYRFTASYLVALFKTGKVESNSMT
jgi:hypothetical protein